MMKEIAAQIKSARNIVITTHIQPDGDAVGSTLALLRILRNMGKNCRAVTPSPVPEGLAFLLRDQDEIIRYRPERDDAALGEAEIFIVLDCADIDRAGEVGRKMTEIGRPMLVIDHHSTNEGFGDLNHIVGRASSTAELLIELLDHLPVVLSIDIAVPLYTAILTDTGGFNYPITTPETHKSASRLLEAGVNPYLIYRQVFLDQSTEYIRLAGLALFNTRLAYGGEVAYSIVPHDLYRMFKPREDELSKLPPHLLTIHGVEISALFLETEPGLVVVELRSQGLVNVASVAKKFGGGGHSGASGSRIRGETTEIVHRVLSELETRLIRARRKGVTEKYRSEIWGRY